MTTEAKLLPCPFCGGDASFGTIRYAEDSDIAKDNGQALFHSVNCVVCGSNNRGLVGWHTKQQAAEHWNTRHGYVQGDDSELLRECLSRFEELYSAMPNDSTWWTAEDRRTLKTMQKVRARISHGD